jgi:histidine ammonia-lyase
MTLFEFDLSDPLLLDGLSLTIDDVLDVARGRPVALAPESRPRIAAAREIVERVIREKRVVYGINTGFGYLKDQMIPEADLEVLQRNLILSHACGVGEPFSREVVRGVILLRANTLIQGYSGVRVLLVERLLELLNRGIHPVIPSRGSVGASGDLAPLAHLGLTLIGEGQAEYQGELRPAAEILAEAGLVPLVLQAKEGLALINGTQPMSSLGCLVVQGLSQLLDIADMTAAMSIQAGLGSCQPFRAELHALRPHPGQRQSAAQLWQWMQKSELIDSHSGCDQVQDAYSFRCVPQVHGASRDACSYIQDVMTREINSVTDNPIILPGGADNEGEIISCGHFHGQPVALAMDFAKVALSELANISERRIERLVNPQLSRGLPAFLTEHGGLNSGLMIAQYAAAALVSENKVLAHPASVDSIPTSANQEDHVSMGTIAANQALQILKHVRQVLGIELICACQALELRAPLTPSPAVAAVLKHVRTRIPALGTDRFMGPDLEAAAAMIADGSLYQRVQEWKDETAGHDLSAK